jgi:hypothetical protein
LPLRQTFSGLGHGALLSTPASLPVKQQAEEDGVLSDVR